MTKENMQTQSQCEELWSINRKKVKIDLRNVTNTIVFLAASQLCGK